MTENDRNEHKLFVCPLKENWLDFILSFHVLSFHSMFYHSTVIPSVMFHMPFSRVFFAGFLQVMENPESHGIQQFRFHGRKVIEFNCRSLKVMEN